MGFFDDLFQNKKENSKKEKEEKVEKRKRAPTNYNRSTSRPQQTSNQQPPTTPTSLFGSLKRFRGGAVVTSTLKQPTVTSSGVVVKGAEKENKQKKNGARANQIPNAANVKKGVLGTQLRKKETKVGSSALDGSNRVISGVEGGFARRRGKENVKNEGRVEQNGGVELRGVKEPEKLRKEKIKVSTKSLNSLLRVQPKPQRPATVALSSNISVRRGHKEGQGHPDNISRTSSVTNLDSLETHLQGQGGHQTQGGKGAKPRKSASKERIDKVQDGKKVIKNNNKHEPPAPSIVVPSQPFSYSSDSLQEAELQQLKQQLREMADEKSSLAVQLGEHRGQLNVLQKEIQKLKTFQEESNLEMEKLAEENTVLRNRLRDVAHSPLSDNEKQQLLFETHRHHSSAPASIATNVLDDNGGNATTCTTPDWDKHSSGNISEVSVACLQDKINQMQETHYSTNEELQATLQELTDLQRQLTELQQENERLNEEKTLMFDSLCRQTERLNDSRQEVENLKQLLYRERTDEASGNQFESVVEREQKLVELLRSAQEERETLLLKLEQVQAELHESRTGNIEKVEDITQLSERVRTLECTLDAKHAEHKQIDQELAQAKDQCSGKQIEINRLTDLLDNARTKINELEQDRALSDKSELDELLDNARKEKDQLESEVAYLKDQLARSKNELEKLKEQVFVLQEECKVTRNNAKTTQSDLEYKCEKLVLEKNGLGDQLQQFQEAVNELQVQGQCHLEDKRQLSAVLSETQRNLSEAERRNMNLENEIHDLKKLRAEENDEWEKFQNDLLTSVRVANDFKTEAQQELQKIILENKTYREKVRLLEGQVEKFKGDKVSTSTQTNIILTPQLISLARNLDPSIPNRLSLIDDTKQRRSQENMDKLFPILGKERRSKSRDNLASDDGRSRKAETSIKKSKSRDNLNLLNDQTWTREEGLDEPKKEHKSLLRKNKIKDNLLVTEVDTSISHGDVTNKPRKSKDSIESTSSSDKSDPKQDLFSKFKKRDKRSLSRGKPHLKSLSVEEEILLKSLDDWYDNIDQAVPEELLSKEDRAVKKLKILYENELLKEKPVAKKPKEQLAISKPLLNSVFSNPKLQEIASNPAVLTVDGQGIRNSSLEESCRLSRIQLDGFTIDTGERPRVKSEEIPNIVESTPTSFHKSKSMDNLNVFEQFRTEEDLAPALYRSILSENLASEENLSVKVIQPYQRQSSEINPTDSVSNPRYSSKYHEEIREYIPNDLPKPNIYINYENLDEIVHKIPKDTSYNLLSEEQKFALKLRGALEEAEKKTTLKKIKKKKKSLRNVEISAPTLESVQNNWKLREILLNPGIKKAKEESKARFFINTFEDAERRHSTDIGSDIGDRDHPETTSRGLTASSRSYEDISFSFVPENTLLNMYYGKKGKSHRKNKEGKQRASDSSSSSLSFTSAEFNLDTGKITQNSGLPIRVHEVGENKTKEDLLYNETLNKPKIKDKVVLVQEDKEDLGYNETMVKSKVDLNKESKVSYLKAIKDIEEYEEKDPRITDAMNQYNKDMKQMMKRIEFEEKRRNLLKPVYTAAEVRTDYQKVDAYEEIDLKPCEISFSDPLHIQSYNSLKIQETKDLKEEPEYTNVVRRTEGTVTESKDHPNKTIISKSIDGQILIKCYTGMENPVLLNQDDNENGTKFSEPNNEENSRHDKPLILQCPTGFESPVVFEETPNVRTSTTGNGSIIGQCLTGMESPDLKVQGGSKNDPDYRNHPSDLGDDIPEASRNVVGPIIGQCFTGMENPLDDYNENCNEETKVVNYWPSTGLEDAMLLQDMPQKAISRNEGRSLIGQCSIGVEDPHHENCNKEQKITSYLSEPTDVKDSKEKIEIVNYWSAPNKKQELKNEDVMVIPHHVVVEDIVLHTRKGFIISENLEENGRKSIEIEEIVDEPSFIEGNEFGLSGPKTEQSGEPINENNIYIGELNVLLEPPHLYKNELAQSVDIVDVPISQTAEMEEYSYQEIIKENKYGVVSPLDLRYTYKSVVKEIKNKFPYEEDVSIVEEKDETDLEYVDEFTDEFFKPVEEFGDTHEITHKDSQKEGFKDMFFKSITEQEDNVSKFEEADDQTEVSDYNLRKNEHISRIDEEMQDIMEKYLHTRASVILKKFGVEPDTQEIRIEQKSNLKKYENFENLQEIEALASKKRTDAYINAMEDAIQSQSDPKEDNNSELDSVLGLEAEPLTEQDLLFIEEMKVKYSHETADATSEKCQPSQMFTDDEIEEKYQHLTEEEMELIRSVKKDRFSRPLSDINERDLFMIEEVSKRYFEKSSLPPSARSSLQKESETEIQHIIEEERDGTKEDIVKVEEKALPITNKVDTLKFREKDLIKNITKDVQIKQEMKYLEHRSPTSVNYYETLMVPRQKDRIMVTPRTKIQENEQIYSGFDSYKEKYDRPSSKRLSELMFNEVIFIPATTEPKVPDLKKAEPKSSYVSKFSGTRSPEPKSPTFRETIIVPKEKESPKLFEKHFNIDNNVNHFQEDRPAGNAKETFISGIKVDVTRHSMIPQPTVGKSSGERRQIRSWSEPFKKKSLDVGLAYEPVYSNINFTKKNKDFSINTSLKKPLPIPRSRNNSFLSNKEYPVGRNDSKGKEAGNISENATVRGKNDILDKMTDSEENFSEGLAKPRDTVLEEPNFAAKTELQKDLNKEFDESEEKVDAKEQESLKQSDESSHHQEISDNLYHAQVVDTFEDFQSENEDNICTLIDLQSKMKKETKLKEDSLGATGSSTRSSASIAIATKLEQLDLTKRSPENEEKEEGVEEVVRTNSNNDESNVNLFKMESKCSYDSYLELFKSKEQKEFDDLRGKKSPVKGFFGFGYAEELSDDSLDDLKTPKRNEDNDERPKIVDFVPLDDQTTPYFTKDQPGSYDTLEREKTFHVLGQAAKMNDKGGKKEDGLVETEEQEIEKHDDEENAKQNDKTDIEKSHMQCSLEVLARNSSSFSKGSSKSHTDASSASFTQAKKLFEALVEANKDENPKTGISKPPPKFMVRDSKSFDRVGMPVNKDGEIKAVGKTVLVMKDGKKVSLDTDAEQ